MGEAFELPIEDFFDLHSVAPRDIVPATQAYLEAAHSRGFSFVRIIHGRGIGFQRERVRDVLKRTPFVASFHDAPPEAGGWGATIAYFKQPDGVA